MLGRFFGTHLGLLKYFFISIGCLQISIIITISVLCKARVDNFHAKLVCCVRLGLIIFTLN